MWSPLSRRRPSRSPKRPSPRTKTPSSADAVAAAAATPARDHGRCRPAGCAATRCTARQAPWWTTARACAASRASFTIGPRTTTWTRTCRAPTSPARVDRTDAVLDGLASVCSAWCCRACASIGPCRAACASASSATPPVHAGVAAATKPRRLARGDCSNPTLEYRSDRLAGEAHLRVPTCVYMCRRTLGPRSTPARRRTVSGSLYGLPLVSRTKLP